MRTNPQFWRTRKIMSSVRRIDLDGAAESDDRATPRMRLHSPGNSATIAPSAIATFSRTEN